MLQTEKFTKEQDDFMAFAKNATTDPKDLMELIEYAILGVKVVFSQSPGVVRHKLKEKLLRGTKHYGSPVYDKRRLLHEFEDECIDLIGWTLVERWNKKRRQKVVK